MMNPSGNADGFGQLARNGSADRRNHRVADQAVPPPLVPRHFRNEGMYGHHPNTFWSGPWIFHHCPPSQGSRHPQPMPQQVFRQHQPFGNLGHQAPAGLYPLPPPAHIPRHYYFDSHRGGNGRARHNHQRSGDRNAPQNCYFNSSSGSTSSSSAHHQRHLETRQNGGSHGNCKKRHQWRKKTNGRHSPRNKHSCQEKSQDAKKCGKICLGRNTSKENSDLKNSELLRSDFELYTPPQSLLRRLAAEEMNSNTCDGSKSEERTKNRSVNYMNGHHPACMDNSRNVTLEELDENEAVGGVSISSQNRDNNIRESAYCQLLDKDLVDEGAICDLDGIFQNQDNDSRSSMCNSDEEQQLDSSLCFGEQKASAILSDDSESENGAYGGLPTSVQLTSHSSHNEIVHVKAKDRISQLKCYGNDKASTNSRPSSYVNNGEWRMNSEGQVDIGHQQVFQNGNMSDSGAEDNGDFIDTDLPSCSKHILSSSDEMENLSSDEERVNPDNADLHCNNLSTVPRNVKNEFENLRLGGENGLSDKCHLMHNEALGNSNCDLKSCNKNSFYSKQAKYLSENSDSDCDNCDISHNSEMGSLPRNTSRVVHSNFSSVDTHLPVIGAAASNPTHDVKVTLSAYPCSDGESFSSASQSQCFHTDVSISGISNLFSSKVVELDQPYIDNPALSASNEQWTHHHPVCRPGLSSFHDPASGPSSVEGDRCCSFEYYSNPINNLSAVCRHNDNGHSANGFGDASRANFINDESNQLQKVFMKKAIEDKLGTEACYSVSSIVDDKEIKNQGSDNNLPERDGGKSGKRRAEELLTTDNRGDNVEILLLPMEEDIEPVHFMAGLGPSGGLPGSGDEEEEDSRSLSIHSSSSSSMANDNMQAGSSTLRCDDCHCECKESSPELINNLPSKEFYQLIKSVSASDSYMRFFDKDGKDVQRSSLCAQTDEDCEEQQQYNRRTGSKSDRLKVDRVMIWNEYEAYVVQFKQIGVSACGQTAVLNVMKALKFNCDKASVCKAIKTSLRKEDKDIPEYLFSRACAGTTATDLKEGVEQLSGGAVGGRFFHLWPPRKIKLLDWLAYWMKRGAIPMATMNLQQGPHSVWEVPDSWHHQMVYGVSDQGLYLTNPLEIVSEKSAMKQLCSDSVLLVRRQDIVSRFKEGTDLSQLLNHPDPRWMSMNVLGQVVNVLRECNMTSVPGYRLQVTSHVAIPASYQAGIMLFMRKDKAAWKSLMTAPELPLLPDLAVEGGDSIASTKLV